MRIDNITWGRQNRYAFFDWVGKTILTERDTPEDEAFVLTFETGLELCVEVVGDCCSHSYFDKDSMLDVTDVLGKNFVGFEEVECGEGERGSDDDWDGNRTLLYALILKTDTQEISLSWRNDSNGYYSGDINYYVRKHLMTDKCDGWATLDRWLVTGTQKITSEYLKGLDRSALRCHGGACE